jgi:hypothetical protein
VVYREKSIHRRYGQREPQRGTLAVRCRYQQRQRRKGAGRQPAPTLPMPNTAAISSSSSNSTTSDRHHSHPHNISTAVTHLQLKRHRTAPSFVHHGSPDQNRSSAPWSTTSPPRLYTSAPHCTKSRQVSTTAAPGTDTPRHTTFTRTGTPIQLPYDASTRHHSHRRKPQRPDRLESAKRPEKEKHLRLAKKLT